MAITVDVYVVAGIGRSQAICAAMHAGILAAGDAPRLKPEASYTSPAASVAVFYGFGGKLPNVMADYRAAGLATVFIDLGYFGRLEGGRLEGYHKVSVNARHPDAYFQRRCHDASRLTPFDITLRPWGRGRSILVAGMSCKHARSDGLGPQQWEQEAIAALRKFTDRPICYRPKPNDRSARPIAGVGYSGPNEPLASALTDCHAVVTHHSNVAIDGAIAGVPSFSQAGVGTAIGLQDLAQIEAPIYPKHREQWLADITWCQWTVAEMRSGAVWRHLKDEGLIPCE